MGFDSGLGDKINAGGQHSLVRRVKIIDAQEEANAACKLLPDVGNLLFPVGAGQE